MGREDARVEVRRFPYPYRAALAICSDLDETPDKDVYYRIAHFLNTTDDTTMGPGVGLEVGNSIYFDMANDQFAYWNTDDAGREMVRELIRSGHIDCLHSFGDLADTREHAARAIDELARHDCRMEVWVDHAVAPTNLGADIMCGSGDDPDAEAYHADLLGVYGVKYVWRGRVTSVIGQDAPARVCTWFTAGHPVASARTFAKEAVKHVLAHTGNDKYAPHATNRVVWRSRLRDGQPCFEFLRSNPHWGGVCECDKGRNIGGVLQDAVFERLIERQGVCVLYTHLGKVADHEKPFGSESVAGFRRLARVRDSGRLMVLTTRRLLRYLTLRDHVSIKAEQTGDVLDIHVDVDDEIRRMGVVTTPTDCGGLTIFVPEGLRYRVHILGETVEQPVLNPRDHTGRASVSLPLERLAFPDRPSGW